MISWPLVCPLAQLRGCGAVEEFFGALQPLLSPRPTTPSPWPLWWPGTRHSMSRLWRLPPGWWQSPESVQVATFFWYPGTDAWCSCCEGPEEVQILRKPSCPDSLWVVWNPWCLAQVVRLRGSVWSPPKPGLVVLVALQGGLTVHRFVGMLLPGLNAMESLQSDSRIQPIQRLPHITHCKTEWFWVLM